MPDDLGLALKSNRDTGQPSGAASLSVAANWETSWGPEMESKLQGDDGGGLLKERSMPGFLLLRPGLPLAPFYLPSGRCIKKWCYHDVGIRRNGLYQRDSETLELNRRPCSFKAGRDVNKMGSLEDIGESTL